VHGEREPGNKRPRAKLGRYFFRTVRAAWSANGTIRVGVDTHLGGSTNLGKDNGETQAYLLQLPGLQMLSLGPPGFPQQVRGILWAATGRNWGESLS
jgi:hypothetical protein